MDGNSSTIGMLAVHEEVLDVPIKLNGKLKLSSNEIIAQ